MNLVTNQEIANTIYGWFKGNNTDGYGGCEGHTLDTITCRVADMLKGTVIIQRGEKRHPYADELHEVLEDPYKILESRYKYGEWTECNVINHDDWTIEYRIKPPVYETSG